MAKAIRVSRERSSQPRHRLSVIIELLAILSREWLSLFHGFVNIVVAGDIEFRRRANQNCAYASLPLQARGNPVDALSIDRKRSRRHRVDRTMNPRSSARACNARLSLSRSRIVHQPRRRLSRDEKERYTCF